MTTTHICERCGKNFKQKSHLDDHYKRKKPCENDDMLVKLIDAKVDERVNTRIMEILETRNERNEVVNERIEVTNELLSVPVKVVNRKRQQPKSNMDNIVSPMSILTELVRKNYSKLSHARNTYEVIASRMNILDNQEDLIAFIGQHLKPKEIEKKQNGEVFTPPELIKQKFDKLTDVDPSVWTDPSKKFLDPANGIGNYPALAFHRLMNGLSTKIPDEYERKKHILENMLFMCELNRKNVEVSKKLFDPKDEFKLNIHCGSFLELDTKEVWGVEKFDVIMGNPPYQLQVGPRKTQPLWNLFVNKSITLMNINGYIVFVHPSGWRSPVGVFKNVYDNIMSLNLVYLNMNDFNTGQEVFKVGTNFDYYIVKNSSYECNTQICDIENKQYIVNLQEFGFIPSGGFDLYEKIIAKQSEEKVNVLYSRSEYGTDKSNMKRCKEDIYKYPCCYTITVKNGMNFFYSSELKGHFGVPKVIWSNGLGTYPIVDIDGKYGLTQFSYAIIDDKNNLINIQSAMNNPLFIKLMTYVKFTNNKYDYKVVRLFKKDFWKEFV